MKYYVTWIYGGETCRETFDNVPDAQKWAKATSRIPWIKEAFVVDESGESMVSHYTLGFLVE